MVTEEKRAWVQILVTVVGYGAYLALVIGRTGGTPLIEVTYAATMLATIGAGIAVAIAFNIAAEILSAEGPTRPDERDREIGRFGSHIGHAFVVIGGVAALVLALAEADHFWIANVLYLCFAASAVVESVAKIAGYRQGMC
jgi:MFS family permease